MAPFSFHVCGVVDTNERLEGTNVTPVADGVMVSCAATDIDTENANELTRLPIAPYVGKLKTRALSIHMVLDNGGVNSY